jgi:hypothetical protein
MVTLILALPVAAILSRLLLAGPARRQQAAVAADALPADAIPAEVPVQ